MKVPPRRDENEFGWNSASGTSYKAHRATDLGASDWTEIGTLT